MTTLVECWNKLDGNVGELSSWVATKVVFLLKKCSLFVVIVNTWVPMLTKVVVDFTKTTATKNVTCSILIFYHHSQQSQGQNNSEFSH